LSRKSGDFRYGDIEDGQYRKDRQMKNPRVYTLAAVVVVYLAGSGFCDQKTYIVYRLAKEPAMDGNVADDPAWGNLPVGSGFIIQPTRNRATEQTRFRMGYTDQALYLGVICEEAPERREPEEETAKGGSPWRHNSIELFLYPPNSEKYYQFMANDRGDRVNLLCAGYYKVVPVEPWEAKLKTGKAGWSLEMKIPYGIFKEVPLPKPEKDRIWTGNVCRNNFNPTGERATCWAYFRATRFHTPEYFARLVFAGDYSPEEARRVEERVIREFYGAELLQNVAKLRAEDGWVAGAKTQDALLQERVARFRRQVTDIVSTSGRLDDLNLQEVVSLLERTQGRLLDADRLKADVLLGRHFDARDTDKMLVYVVRPTASPSVWIRPTDALIPGRLSDEIKVVACPGEYEPASFVVQARSGITGLRPEATDLKGAEGTVPSSAIDIKLVKCWYQAGSAGYGHAQQKEKHVLVPELLLNDDSLVKVDREKRENYLRLSFPEGAKYFWASDPAVTKSPTVHPSVDEFPVKDSPKLLPVDIPARENQQFWITVHVPEDARPGNYLGGIHLESRGGRLGTLALKVKVLPVKLLPPYYTSGIYYGGGLDPSGKGAIASTPKSPLQYRREMENLIAHGVDSPIIPVLFKREGEERVYDDSVLAPVLEIRKSLGMLDRPIYIGGFFWQALKIKQPKLVKRIDLTPELKKHLQNIVRRIVTLARSYGATDVYFYGLDEAKGERLTCQREAWKAIQEAGGKVFVAGYAGSNFREMGDIQDLLICAGYPSRREAEKWHSKGHKIWCYANPQGGIENAEVNRRNFGLLLWKHKYDGAATWTYMSTGGRTWNDFDSPKARDYNFVYPTVDGVIDTVQWEGYREGVDDVRYVTALEAAIRKAEASGDPHKTGAASKAKRYLEELDVEGRDLDAVRLEMIEHILRLQ